MISKIGATPLQAFNTLDIATARGDMHIRADQLATISNAELKRWRISRADLQRCFVEGAALMQGRDPAEVRATAHETLSGEWEVILVHYSAHTRPKRDQSEALPAQS